MMCSAWPGCRRQSAFRWFALAGACVLNLATARLALAQETCATASPIVLGAAFSGNNSGAVTDTVPGVCVDTARDVWHSFVASVDGVYTISLCGSPFDTIAAVYADCLSEPLACNDDACGAQSQLVTALQAGATYYVRVAAQPGGAGGAYRVQVTPPAGGPPTNNICGAGGSLPPNQQIIGTTAGASGNDVTGACGGAGDRLDVWYSYNPSAGGVHIAELCSQSFDAVLSVHSSCFNSTLLGCSDDDAVAGCPEGSGSRVVFNATAGTTVLIRVAGTDGSFGPYSLMLHTAAANDLCANAPAMARGFVYTGVVTPAMGTEGVASCAPSAHDAWHAHVATVTGPHTFSACATPFDTVVSVYRGCPGTPGAEEVACSDNGCVSGLGAAVGASEVVADLEIAQLYFVRVAGRTAGSTTAAGNYSIRVDFTPPPNDECTSAALLSLGVPVSAITSGASGADVTACGFNDRNDVWYSFTAPGPGTYEFNTCGSVMNTTLALFSSCATLVACSDDEPGFCGADFPTGGRLELAMSGGQAVLVRVAGVNTLTGQFRLVVNRAPPSNDSCAGAQVLSEGVAAGGTLTGALASGSPDCAGSDNPDAFYLFTPAQTRHYRISTCGSATKTTLSLYSVCPPATAIACSTPGANTCGVANNTDLVTVLSGGIPHRVRVSSAPGEPATGFQIIAEAVAPPNDDCTRAQRLALNSLVPAATIGAGGVDESPCGGMDAHDVWFDFVPEQTGTYEFITCGLAGSPDTTLAVYDDCGASALACNDDATGSCGGSPLLSRIALRLEVGQTYLVRAAVGGGGEGAFYVGVRYARPVNDSCSSALPVSDGSITFDTLGATTDPIMMNGCGLGIVQIPNDIWYRYVAPVSGPVIVSTCASDFDTAVAVLEGESGCGSGLAVLACDENYDCDQSPQTPNLQSRAVFQATAGRASLIRVGSTGGERGAGTIQISRPGAVVCRCDWNGVDRLTVQDVFDFLIDWFVGTADFNQNGTSELQDLFDFLTCYLTNPPECR